MSNFSKDDISPALAAIEKIKEYYTNPSTMDYREWCYWVSVESKLKKL
jgi:hypothetical protein